MSKNNKTEYHIVKTSAQKLSLDLTEFSKELMEADYEVLHIIFSHCENIKFQISQIRDEYLKRSQNK